MSNSKIDISEGNVIALLCPYLRAFAYNSKKYLMTYRISPATVSSDSGNGTEVKNQDKPKNCGKSFRDSVNQTALFSLFYS